MKGLPVTVRLLDPPLHEFLPHEVDAQKSMAKDLGVSFAEVKRRVSMLHEMNPMLGHRGCRLAITYPEIATMQARAITEAAIQCLKKGVKARPEIMIPLIGTRRELEILRELILDTHRDGDEGEEVHREARYSGRHDDRDPPGGAHRRRGRGSRGLLQFRHQRPHADGLRLQPGRLPACSCPST